MKKLFVIIIAVLFVGTIQETKAQFSVGAGLGYASDISSIGISANVGYEINETLQATGAYTYFLEKDDVKWSAIDFNANYSFGKLYAIGGLNITTVKVDLPGVSGLDLGSDYGLGDEFSDYVDELPDYINGSSIGGDSVSDSNFGVNLGVGVKIDLSERMYLAPEMTYTISNGSYLRIGAKLMFNI